MTAAREEIAADASAGGTGADPMAFPHDYHLGVWRDFLDAVEEKRPPRISGEEALEGASPDRCVAGCRRQQRQGAAAIVSLPAAESSTARPDSFRDLPKTVYGRIGDSSNATDGPLSPAISAARSAPSPPPARAPCPRG